MAVSIYLLWVKVPISLADPWPMGDLGVLKRTRKCFYGVIPRKHFRVIQRSWIRFKTSLKRVLNPRIVFTSHINNIVCMHYYKLLFSPFLMEKIKVVNLYNKLTTF